MKKMKQVFAGILAAVVTVTALPAPVPAEITDIEWGIKPEDGTTKWQPFASGTGGSKNFRIPGIVTLDNGTLVAACDARWDHAGDGCGLDTIVSRSTDNGETWNYTFANYIGDYGNKKNLQASAFIDPAIATDGKNIYMIADVWPGGYDLNTAPGRPVLGNEFDENGNLLLSDDNRQTYAYHLERNTDDAYGDSYYVIKNNESGTVAEGYTIDAYFNIQDSTGTTNLFCANSPYLVLPTDYLYLTKSADGGATWSIPSLLRLKKPTEKALLVGPGRGIVTSGGRIVFTAYEYTDGDRNSACIYSDDGGLTWKRGESVPQTSSEAAIVEADKKLYIFTRHGGYNVSTDWGETWSEVIMPEGIAYNLNCELSAITYSRKIDGKTAIIFSAPSNTGKRAAGKLFAGLVQDDGTISWDYQYSVNGAAYYAYSCLTELKDGSIGLLYEDGSASIAYTNIPISDIADGAAIGDLWCEDENGEIVTDVLMRSNDSVDLRVFHADASAVITASADQGELLKAEIADGTLTIKSGNVSSGLSQGLVTLASGTDTLQIHVSITDDERFEIVNLRMGDTYDIADDKSSDVSISDETIVKQVQESDKWTIEAVQEGKTEVTFGGVTYYVFVKNEEKNIRLEKDQYIVIRGSNIQIEADRAIVSTERNKDLPPYEKTNEIVSGGKYLIGNMSSIVISRDSEDKDPVGRAMQPAYFKAEDLSEFVWTVQQTGEGYTIQDKEGKYLSFNGRDVLSGDEEQALTIGNKDDGFEISYGGIYLNNYGGKNVRAAGYGSSDNIWYFYQIPDSYKITGLADGTAILAIDGTTYYITVVDTKLTEEAETKLGLKVKDAETLLGQVNLSSEYTEASVLKLKQAYEKVLAILSSAKEHSLLELQNALEELDKAMQLEKIQNKDDGSGQTNPGADNQGNQDAPEIPAKNSKYSDGKANYIVTASSASGGTVVYVGPKKKTEKKIVVPDSVTINSLNYKVTEIAANAMKNNKKLTQVTIGANVKKIGKSAFAKCTKLKKITVKSTVLKSVGKKAISGINKKCAIKVPKKKKAAYKKLFKTAGWKSSMKLS